jgi:hypothetical protein
MKLTKRARPLDRPSGYAETCAELAGARAITLCDTGLFISEREESLIVQAELSVFSEKRN